jgi:rSAM/selenodomain-associated transferase 2
MQPLRQAGHEIILVDGGSIDRTAELSRPLVDRAVVESRGRARQMNVGAGRARGDVLLFVHADTTLPPGADRLVLDGLAANERGWGRFDVRLSGGYRIFRMVEYMMNWRSSVTSIATGDQGIFVCRKWFEAVGGYPDIPLMEDIALSEALKRLGPPLCISRPVETSSRRWERHGPLRTILLMWGLRLAYFLGVSPARLHRLYCRHP